MISPAPQLLIIGLTGGIGSGKSAAARHFEELGAEVIDTDAISHALTAAGGPAIPALRQRFGDNVAGADGALDRSALRQRVFADAAERTALEAILHPMIRAEVARRLADTRRPYAIVVVPLLVESGAYRTLCRRIAVVDCSEATQLERTMRRSQLSEEQVGAIMRAQATRSQRLAVADDVILNEGSLEDLRSQVRRLHEEYGVLSAAERTKS